MADWTDIGIDLETQKWMIDILRQVIDAGYGRPSFEFVIKNHIILDIEASTNERRRLTEGRTYANKTNGVAER